MMQIASNLIDFNWWSLVLAEYVLHPFIMITLCLLSVFVVLGNLLVVSAIWHEHQLHSVTNYLIASLAAADCLVGAVVMPFSIISEIIIGSWTFGEAWCDLWHSFDVLASTASIMNLCAISLDRYLAITDPISYPTRMTPRRVALLIVSLWTCSSLISFPAILWWRAVGEGPLQQFMPSTIIATTPTRTTNATTTISPMNVLSSSSSLTLSSYKNLTSNMDHEEEVPQYRCVFTDDPYYLLFSSFISFYGPLCVMLYAYYRIYKAAVQQTRFLKYGSKQVMIGKRSKKKKKKRLRNISEHSSIGGTSEKNKFTEENCDGTSNMESYDRQHLVLRAHRGGGGGASSSAITTKGSVSSDMVGTKNSNDRKRRENQNCEQPLTAAATKISPDTENTETTIRAIEYQISDGREDQSTLSKNNGPQELLKNKTAQHNSVCSSNRNDRIELTSRSSTGSTRRDKLRVDSQRFDSKPIRGTMISYNDSKCIHPKANNNNEDDNIGSHINGLPDTTSIEFADKENDDEDEKKSEIGNLGSQCEYFMKHSNNNYNKQHRAKPLLSYINNKRSTSVDVSIIDHSDPISQCAQRSNILSISSARDHYNMRETTTKNKNYHKDSSFIEVGNNNKQEDDNEEEEDNGDHGVDSDSEEFDEMRSDSLSSSSGSYGTGSIASVLVKPEMLQRNSSDINNNNNQQIKTNNNYHHTQPKQLAEQQQKLKRALSHGDERDCEQGPKLRIDEVEDEDVFNSPPFDCQAHSIKFKQSNKHHHRASCGDPSFHVKAFDTANSSGGLGGYGSRAAKTLNIRSWVKLTRTRNSSKVESNQSENILIKPPPSLMPLMMMNSDTSTDSSIVSNVIKRATNRKGGAKEIMGNADVEDATKMMKVDNKNYNIINENDRASDNNSSKTNVRLSADSGAEAIEHVVIDNLTDKNLTFKEDLERGVGKLTGNGSKGQMLFYNSEKLIQSIVDLSAVHYIDCANHNSKNPVGNKAIQCKSQNDVSDEMERLDLDPTEKVLQLPLGEPNGRVNNIPRNHRSVGKKLSKLAKERKAAKTLGIVVGVFILCWLPFFVVNIVVALCGTNCIYKLQIFFPIVTWLGWLNSAMNPVIYACWSRDFRRAFRRVLCAWVEFVCPYDGANMARRLKLKKSSNYSTQEAYLNRNASSIKCNTSSATIRSVGVSIDGRVYGPMNGKATVRNILSDQ